ncbi:dihydrolipoamide acetyltransferase family protein [Actinomadura verrucosospora]|uniref:Dihydrolipoamide acetyltransferase component of pyruvate dehydrogenase complex n=1 Tax=Actinomadura verrucosospora TaxID=46165 RepID=A0A7D4AKY9_ACTVE|nr:dihydrolipoamide acetyltransferase family protein [Actinomadura verrucosospora]QKG20948.1 pyruvate dehydrogenase complex dihydrolipoamide acetyltransferase [Actinomadura verrucosospora]
MTEILMPRLSDTMEEGVISSWQKQPGDEVAVGDVLVDIETDKAVMEYEAYEAGVLEKILVGEGETAAIGAPIAVVVPAGGARPEAAAPEQAPEQAAAAPAPAPAAEQEPAAAPAPQAEPEPAAASPAPAAAPAPAERRTGRSRPPSSPLARRLARDHGLDLASLSGSGPGGRIVRADIEAAIRDGAQPAAPAAAAPAPAAPAQAPAPAAAKPQAAEDPDVEAVPLNRFRKVAARRLTESKQNAPHFYLNREVDAEALLAFRATLNEALAPAKVSVNDLVVKAVATALREHPEVNVSYTEENLLFHKRVHVGVAVAVADGLVVPVVKDADRKSVSQIGAETRELAGKARDGKLSVREMSGGTFSVSNLGMFGVDSFSAVINPPEAAILAVGAVRDEPVVRDGQVVPGKRMAVTLSVDHRACDGATAAKFLARLAELLRNPLLIVA